MRKSALLSCLACLAWTSAAQAGGGHVNPDGSVELNVNFTYPPTQQEVLKMIAEFQIASRVLCDASDGAIRIGQLNVTSGPGDRDKHDMIIMFQSDGRSRSDLLGLGPNGDGFPNRAVSMDSGDLVS